MLSVDLTGLSESELNQAVRARCAHAGKVTATTIYRADDAQAWPFALVEMSNASELSRLASELGEAVIGNAVLIQLAPEVRVPDFLRRSAIQP
jgi:hypothetical protein